jgi:hypothetical protein
MQIINHRLRLNVAQSTICMRHPKRKFKQTKQAYFNSSVLNLDFTFVPEQMGEFSIAV